MSFITENIGTILVGIVILGIVSLIITKLINDKRKGKHIGCDGCNGCSKSSHCHNKIKV